MRSPYHEKIPGKSVTERTVDDQKEGAEVDDGEFDFRLDPVYRPFERELDHRADNETNNERQGELQDNLHSHNRERGRGGT